MNAGSGAPAPERIPRGPSGCLLGIRVLDLSQYLPGPHAAQILADLGAEVIKVEPPEGDPMRRIGPLDADGTSAFYKLINAGKGILRLDLKSEVGAAVLHRLAAAADVLLESFRPGALARLGFSAETLRAANPRLVHCALSGYGQSGPAAGHAGHDINYMALAGGLATSGPAERPAFAHPPTADFAGGMQAALAVLAALLRRQRTGAGSHVDVSLAESVLAWQGAVLTGALRAGHRPGRAAALLNGGAACYRIYETADGRFVSLGALEAKFWANFCRAVGREDWIARQAEALPQQALIAEVAALVRSRPRPAWERALAGIDCCFQPLLEPEEVPEAEQVRARGLVRRTGGSEPRFEVLFPAFFDAVGPNPRPEPVEQQAGAVLAAWEGRAGP